MSSLPFPQPSNSRNDDVQLGVVGCGYWGKNLLRNAADLGALRWACDSRTDILDQLQSQYPDLKTSTHLDHLLHDSQLDAVMIATPSHTHYALAKQAIEAGKHVYIEKPMATTVNDAEALCQLANKHDRHLMVGHLLLYHPAMNRLKQLIEAGELGELAYLQSDRLNWNWPRADVNVMWDLSPHDFSVLLYLSDAPLKVTQAIGHATQPDGKIDTVQIALKADNGLSAMVQASWVFPKKQVQLMAVGSKANAILDDSNPQADKLRLLLPDAGQKSWESRRPEFLPLEPLKLEVLHFINMLKTRQASVTNGETGLEVVRLLETAQTLLDKQASMAKGLLLH